MNRPANRFLLKPISLAVAASILFPTTIANAQSNEEEVIENCKTVCQLTHHDPRCVDSCQIHGLIIARELNGGDTNLQSILNAIPNLDKRTLEYIETNFTEDISTLNLDDKNTWGYTLKSLCAGLWGYYYAESFEQGLKAIIMEGGDADTNGCIAGSLMGAKFQNIPKIWIDGLFKKIKI